MAYLVGTVNIFLLLSDLFAPTSPLAYQPPLAYQRSPHRRHFARGRRAVAKLSMSATLGLLFVCALLFQYIYFWSRSLEIMINANRNVRSQIKAKNNKNSEESTIFITPQLTDLFPFMMARALPSIIR